MRAVNVLKGLARVALLAAVLTAQAGVAAALPCGGIDLNAQAAALIDQVKTDLGAARYVVVYDVDAVYDAAGTTLQSECGRKLHAALFNEAREREYLRDPAAADQDPSLVASVAVYDEVSTTLQAGQLGPLTADVATILGAYTNLDAVIYLGTRAGVGAALGAQLGVQGYEGVNP